MNSALEYNIQFWYHKHIFKFEQFVFFIWVVGINQATEVRIVYYFVDQPEFPIFALKYH